MSIETLIEAFEAQAEFCDRAGSAFVAALARGAKADISAGGPTLELVRPWSESSRRQIFSDAMTLRLFGALHDLVLSGEASSLAARYPTDDAPGDGAAAYAEAVRLMHGHHARFAAFMTHEPQTNEVRRSAALLGGFLAVGRETGLPFRCFELGASAGLNQLWDRYWYELGQGRTWGDPASPVRLISDGSGGVPSTEQAIVVAERRACDRRPVRLDDAAERRRLAAYVWPDQRDRLRNLQAAIAMASEAGVQVEAADAADWARAEAAPKAGFATVVYHSIFWQYMPTEAQAATRAAIERHGAAATSDAPFAWVRLEPDPDDLLTIKVRLTLWPGGQERVLAESHPHANWVKWA